LKIDFHCHTHYSSDSIAKIDEILNAAHRQQLDKLVITDHNTICGAIEAHALEPDFVIVGEEVKTTSGELLAFFVKEEVPANLDPFKAIEELKAQGAFISVSHPMDNVRPHWPLKMLKEIAPFVDAIEVGNARVFRQDANDQARNFAAAHGLPGTAGSDGHHPYEIGRMALEMDDFNDTESLRRVISSARMVGRISPTWVHLYSVQAKIVKAINKGKYS
jgi:predicted metal-dependent phosphoesterase TrpH